MQSWTVISGCSGGGKSTLVDELRRRGFATVAEPGRRIVAEELAAGRKSVMPWVDLGAFARKAVGMALADRDAARQEQGRVFYDRGLVDAAAALEHATGQPQVERLCRDHPYGPTVFMVPPWPEIFVADDERRHDMVEAVAEYGRLLTAYAQLGYAIEILAKVGVAERADLVQERLGAILPSRPSSSSSSRRGSDRPSRA